MSAAVFEERVDPGQFASALLSAVVHLLLLAVLIFGVQWQNRPPETVAVELWEPPPPPPPAPVLEAPKPLPQAEPAPVEVKPEPVVPKPDIVEKRAEKVKPPPKPAPVPKVEPRPIPKPIAKVEPKPVPKPAPKVEPARPRVDETKRFQEELRREQASLAIDRDRDLIKEQLAREASAGNARALAGWIDKVRGKIRGNIVLPPDIQGNPEAVFNVVQLPTGEVLSTKLVKSSGHRAYDEAVERAILKSSPLPKPDKAELFSRELKLTFRPKDKD